MPRKKRGGRAGGAVKRADPEDRDRMAELDSLLRQFDAEVERRIYELRHTGEQMISKIDSSFKIAKMKMNAKQRNTLFEVAMDEDVEAPDQPSSGAQSAGAPSRTNVKASAAKPGGQTTHKVPMDFATPLQLVPPLYSSTPAVTPKFDPRTVHKGPTSTLRRPRPGEVFMSMEGSPLVNDADRKSADDGSAKQQFAAIVSALSQLAPANLENLDDNVEEDTKSLISQLKQKLSTHL